MQPPFICHTCKKELRERKILLLPHGTSAFMYFIVIVLNDSKFYLTIYPVNTLINFFLIIYGLIVGSILMTVEPSIIWLVFLLLILYRFLSYYYVERFSLNES